MLTVIVGLAWALGGWHSAMSIVQTTLICLGGAYLVWLLLAGWIELRQRRTGRASGPKD